MNVRVVLGVVVLGAGAWALFEIFHTPPAVVKPTLWTSSGECAPCHQEVYDEWKVSWHAQSWTDVEVRKQSEDYSNVVCLECHSPQPVFDTGIGNRVLTRTTRQIEGVDCITCHWMPDNRVAGTVDNAGVACRPLAQRELIRPEFCSGCHNQHGTVDQWQASRFAQAGDGFRDCLDCHMPFREGDPAKGRDHTMHAGHDLELVRSAVELRVARVAGQPVVEVENVGAGHNYPTDERSRASDLFWRPISDDPQAWRHLYRFRNPYRHEVGLPDTELPAGEKVTLPIDSPDAAGPIEAALFYKLTPYWTDPEHPDPESEASLVHARRLEP